MATPNTQQFTSAAYVYTALAADYDTQSNDPRALNVREGRYNRAVLVTSDGTLVVIDVEGTTVDIAQTLPAGTLVPIQCRSLQASSTCTALVLY